MRKETRWAAVLGKALALAACMVQLGSARPMGPHAHGDNPGRRITSAPAQETARVPS